VSKKPLIIISGPTASGKTATSIRLAKLLADHNPRIINFDSLLFYKELNIGTAKPTKEEQAGIKHSLIDVRSITEPLNAADFTIEGLRELEVAYTNNELPILVGGSGFYLRALVKGMYDSVDVSDEIKELNEKIYADHGIDPFISDLEKHDPDRIAVLHHNDHYRIRRAWEHWKMTGKPVSPAGADYAGGDPYDFSINRLTNWQHLHLHLDMPRPEHFEIISNRTRKMLEAGFVEETKSLLNAGFSGEEKPLQSIGYKEILMMFQGEIAQKDLPERIDGVTRRLAKQQRTFFARITPKTTYHPLQDIAKIEADVIEWLKQVKA